MPIATTAPTTVPTQVKLGGMFNNVFGGLLNNFGDVFDNSNMFNSMFTGFGDSLSRGNHPAGQCLMDGSDMMTLDQCYESGGSAHRAFCSTNCETDQTICIGNPGTRSKTVSRCAFNICYPKVPIIAEYACEEISTECLQSFEENCEEYNCSEESCQVCGSDGQKYSNPCWLRKTSCERNEEINVAGDDQCPSFFEKIFTSFTPGASNSDCDEMVCPMMHDPVCGSDGDTYGNECQLKAKMCKMPWLEKLADGECQCPEVCPTVLEPVCGTDGKTYGNGCMLMKAACEGVVDIKGVIMMPQQKLTVAALGTCPDKATRKECGACAKTYGPVCASNGKSYISERCFNVAVCEEGLEGQVEITKRTWCNKEDEDRYWMASDYPNGMVAQRPVTFNPLELEQRPIIEQRPSVSADSIFNHPIFQRPLQSLLGEMSGASPPSVQLDAKPEFGALEIVGDRIVEREDNDCGACAKTYGPVCGSDGKSYISERCFEVEKCRQGQAGNGLVITSKTWCNDEDKNQYWMESSYTNSIMESSSSNTDGGISGGIVIEQRPVSHHMVIEQRPVTFMPMVIQQRPVIEQRPVVEQRPSIFGTDNNVFSNNMFSNFQSHFQTLQSPFQSIFGSGSSSLSNIFSLNSENEDHSPSEIARQNAVSLDFKP